MPGGLLSASQATTDYVIDILLIVVIFRQVRPRELTLHTTFLPLALLIVARIIYLKPITLQGNDLALIAILAIVGIVLGVISGRADKVFAPVEQEITVFNLCP